MKYEVFVSPSRRYVVCRVTGEITAECARQFGKAADEMSRAEAIPHRLFDVREARNVETVAGNYEFAYKDMASLKIDRSMRAAILVAPGDDSHDFVATAITNAGYSVRMFTSEAEAVAWLEEGKGGAVSE
jgi:hypothetical protein